MTGIGTWRMFICRGASYTSADMVEFIQTPLSAFLVCKHDAHTAIDHEFGSRDKAGLIACNKRYKICNFLWRTDPPKRLEAQHTLFCRFGINLLIKPTLDQRRSHPPGANCVDANVIRGIVQRQVSG